jgi:hypothetical protein
MLICIKLCTHIWQIDGEVTEIPRMLQLSQFILGNSLYIITLTLSAHLKSQRRYHEVSASIARVWQMLCLEYPFYHGNYWQTDWPSTFGNRITFKDSTDSISHYNRYSSQIPTDSSGKARRKRILLIYANEQSDILFDWPLSDKAHRHVTYTANPLSYGQPISFVWQHTLPYLGSVVKLYIVRGERV